MPFLAVMSRRGLDFWWDHLLSFHHGRHHNMWCICYCGEKCLFIVFNSVYCIYCMIQLYNHILYGCIRSCGTKLVLVRWSIINCIITVLYITGVARLKKKIDHVVLILVTRIYFNVSHWRDWIKQDWFEWTPTVHEEDQ